MVCLSFLKAILAAGKTEVVVVAYRRITDMYARVVTVEMKGREI